MARTLLPPTGAPADQLPGLVAKFGNEGTVGPEGALWFTNPAYNPPAARKNGEVEASSPDFGDGAFGNEGALWFTKPAYNPAANPEREG
ncbi:MAG: hypothetical protein WAJ85_12450 [Candidatus Baltobacteraceae bacterium]